MAASQAARQGRYTVALGVALLCMSVPLDSLAGELRIRGRVLSEKGDPVANVTVWAICTGALPEGPHIDCGFPGMMGRKEQTDGDGRFFLAGLPAAMYSLYVGVEASKGRIASEAAIRLPLREDANGIELKLKPLRSISGKVVDTDGKPVAKAQVSAQMEKGTRPEEVLSERTRGSATTDEDGEFEIRNLADGPYQLEARADRFGTTSLGRSVRPEEDPVTLRMQACARVIGRAVKPDGSPVEDLSDDCRGLKSLLPDGRFEDVHCGDAGEMLFCLSAPGMASVQRRITLERGKTLDLGNVRMEPARELKVRVTEAGTGLPIDGVSVQVDEPLPRRVFETDGSGVARLTDYPDKKMDLLIRGRGGPERRITVARGQTEVQVVLEAGVGVSGRVLDAEGKPHKGMVRVSCSQGGSDQVPLDEQGEFRIAKGLAGGICNVQLQLFASPMPDFEHYRMFYLDPQNPPKLELRTPAVRNTIHVRFNGNGKPNKAVLYVGELPSQLPLKSLSSIALMPSFTGFPETQGYRAGTKEEGGFRFERIGPGPYTLVVAIHHTLFRVPLTVGAQQETFTVDIPENPTRILE
ncbi:MAG TPA: carboxypeptidase regulatory-like domain-containing protein [Myxococcaceae bacterium]|jgi:hypothetical protein